MPHPDPPVQRFEVVVTLNAPLPAEVITRLQRIEQLLATVVTNERTIMATQQDILDEIAAESTIADSILTLVQTLVSENDPNARQAILDALLKNKGKLEAAVLAGTPQAPTP